jgi:uncharacterized membrane protein
MTSPMTSPPSTQSPAAGPPRLWARALRLLRHRWAAGWGSGQQLGSAEIERLTQAIAHSESRHSAQIQLCIETSLPPSYAWRAAPLADICRARALSQFAKLRVWDTEHNNGVLIYLLLPEHAIEIVADRALQRSLPAASWTLLLTQLQHDLRQPGADSLVQALSACIEQLSLQLQPLYPRAAPDQPGLGNELPDRPHLL